MVTDTEDAGTLDLFGDFNKPTSRPKKNNPQIIAKKKIEKKSIDSTLDIPAPPEKNTITEPYFSDDDDDEPIVLKRDLCDGDRGWHREFIPNLNDHAYLSNSRIKQIITSMQHFNWRYILRHKSEDTDAKRLGRIVHSAILEPDKFRKNHEVIPKFEGKGSRAAKSEYIAGLDPDAIILKQEDVDKVLYMIDSVLNHPKAAQVIRGGTFEVNGYVYDERRKVYWLIKPDILKTTLIGDLKTTKCASPESFSRDIFNFGYYIQVPIYLDGANLLLPQKVEQFPFVVVENCEPYVTEVYFVAPQLIEMGRNIVDMAVDKYHHHMNQYEIAKSENKKYFWPGYTGHARATEINIPTWAQYRLEAIVETHEG